MSDIRALTAGKRVPLGSGLYVERAATRHSEWEERLRTWYARLQPSGKRKATRFTQRVGALEAEISTLDDEALCAALHHAVTPMHQHGFADQHLARAFAVIREASRRCTGKRHHDVQLLAGRALLHGKLAEMATGEGKTLAGTLAICTAAATGASVHVVTVNDYLAERDAEHNKALFDFFQLSLGIIEQDMPPQQRTEQYAQQIVYVSNKELTFDYLKDRIAIGHLNATQVKLNRLFNEAGTNASILRGLHLAIIDEADSVLIDEARTPLIISETIPDDLGETLYHEALTLANGMLPEHYTLGKNRDVWLTPAGRAHLQTATAKMEGLWQKSAWQQELVQKALSALHLFKRDQHYIIADDKVQIVDESTGRVMPDRTWERGLHQMIEAKEGCEITGQRRTLSQITYQRFFGRYLLLGGMTGTAKEIEPEVKRSYNLSVERIATHKPSKRQRLADHVFLTEDERWQKVIERASHFAGLGRAVLIGTRSVEASERLGQLLTEAGLAHTVLNARNDADEAELVADAGQAGRITVATNMAGRGTDIKLAPEVHAAGGLHVILTEFHDTARVDRQLFGRAARQGDPGTVEAVVCLHDEVFTRFAPTLARLYHPWVLSGRPHGRLFRWLVWHAQQRSERHHRRQRLQTLKQDRQWLMSLGFVAAHRK
ncbi:MAG TPA: DEAD/DEAH box helicase [Chitinolyticbacter sp.]|nr:DEAD/DEAH box helicase [Chitinolyticbacter sp.]